MSNSRTRTERVWFLDTLRYIFVIGVVVLHAIEPQMTLENDWAVDDPRMTPVSDQVVVFLDVILMSALFFIAGYFALPTLAKRGALHFCQRKFWGLVVPAMLVVVVINPVWKYVYHLTRSWAAGEVPLSYGKAWWLFLSSVPNVEIGHLHSFNFSILHVWFISVLLLFYVPIVVFFRITGGANGRWAMPLKRETSTRRVSLILVATTSITCVCVAVMNTFVMPFQWIAIGPALAFEVPYILQYITYFGLGLYAYRRQWFSGSHLFGAKKYWLAVFFVTLVSYQASVQYLFIHTELMESRLITTGIWMIRLWLCVSCFVLILIFGMTYCNQPHPIHKHLAANSYRTYLLHPAVVVLVQLQFFCWSTLDWLSTFAGTLVVSVIASYLVSVLVGLLWQGITWGALSSRPCVKRVTPLIESTSEAQDVA